MKKQEALDESIRAQDEKLVSLQSHGAELIQQSHPDGPAIQAKLEEVAELRKRVGDLAAARRRRLVDGLVCARFLRDVSEVGDLS